MTQAREKLLKALPPGLRSRKSAPRREWKAEDYIRGDWGTEHLIERLEQRARGYDGLLRELLCTSAEALRQQNKVLLKHAEEVQVALGTGPTA